MTQVQKSVIRAGWRSLLALSFLLAGWGLSIAQPAAAQETICAQLDRHVAIPLTDLGDQPYVRMDGQPTEFIGGLYPGGVNQRPAAHEAAGLRAAAQIVPLDANGNPSPQGKIVLLSLGMSNAASEFNRFMELAHEQRTDINPNLVIVNGALGGQTADRWLELGNLAWNEAAARLTHRKVTPQQVQVVWIKQVLTNMGGFPDKALELQSALETIVHNLYQVYPNLKIIYLSSRTRSYLYGMGLSPEPAAYESAFAVRWLIEKQINGDPELNYDPARGEAKAPFLSWGPYLWIDGETARSDGRVWKAEDLAVDCTHPSRTGVNKVGEMLMEFFRTDTTAVSWFLAGGSQPDLPAVPPASPIPLASPTVVVSPSPAPSTTSTSPPATATLTSASPQAGATFTPIAPSIAEPATQPETTPPPGSAGGSIYVWLAPLLVALGVLTVYGVIRWAGRRGR